MAECSAVGPTTDQLVPFTWEHCALGHVNGAYSVVTLQGIAATALCPTAHKVLSNRVQVCYKETH